MGGDLVKNRGANAIYRDLRNLEEWIKDEVRKGNTDKASRLNKIFNRMEGRLLQRLRDDYIIF